MTVAAIRLPSAAGESPSVDVKSLSYPNSSIRASKAGSRSAAPGDGAKRQVSIRYMA